MANDNDKGSVAQLYPWAVGLRSCQAVDAVRVAEDRELGGLAANLWPPGTKLVRETGGKRYGRALGPF